MYYILEYRNIFTHICIHVRIYTYMVMHFESAYARTLLRVDNHRHIAARMHTSSAHIYVS